MFPGSHSEGCVNVNTVGAAYGASVDGREIVGFRQVVGVRVIKCSSFGGEIMPLAGRVLKKSRT